ncbi:MAG: gliding motility-associated C-terminal domain-containing protein [Flavobacteriales bacterium]|nr:gliding motility-associated C-terminal domain-containing protein [Flavobacteriales bacterium]
MRYFLFVTFLFILHLKADAQCANPTVMLDEPFNSDPITGAVTANIYGSGFWNNASYTLSGQGHGWFNVVNGVSNVDVYDRQVNGFCIDSAVTVTFWTRHSFGNTNVTYSVIDDANSVLATTTLNLTTVYQQVTFNFTATTPGLRFVIHCNSTGGNGVDICVEDLLITHCANPPSEDHVYGICSPSGTVDLFSFFSNNIDPGGTWSGPSALSNGHLGTFDPSTNTQGVYQYSVPSNCGVGVSSVEIEIMPDVDLGNDTTLCAGSSIVLDAGAGFDEYLWSNMATTQTINVATAGTYSVQVSSSLGNLISDPGFESNSPFYTDYAVGTGGSWGLVSNPGTYAVATSPNLAHNNFASFPDHTTSGPGNMLVVNGSSVPGTNVWCQDVLVTPNTDYMFSAWVATPVNPSNVANLQFYVDGLPIGSVFNAPTVIGQWQQYSDTWNSGGNTSITICIVNQNTTGGGNDFCLDDLMFAPVCTKSDDIQISIETPSQVVSTVNPTCNGDADGEIHVDNNLAVEYSFDGGTTWQADSFLLNVSAGSYSACSRTALGCVLCETVTIVDPAQVLLTVSSDTTICENGTAQLSASATGGTTWDFYWSHTTDLNGNQSVSPLVNTTYTVYAQNENGCESLPLDIDVSLHPPLSGTISIFDSICPGFSSDLSATASGGIGAPYTFTWSTGDVFTGNGVDQITVSPGASSDYTVTISDGCESTPVDLLTNVYVAPLPVPSVNVLNPNQCEPAQFQIVNTTPNTLYSYWLVDGNQQFVNQNTIVTWDMYAGSYDLQLVITSTDGCVDSATFTDLLVVDPLPEANFGYSPNPVLMFNTEVNFTNLSYNGSTYEWFFEEGNPSFSTDENPTVMFPDGVDGEYDVTLITTSDLGCTDTITIPLVVLPEVLMYAPNAFTPDGDEHNQNWRIHIVGIDVYDFQLQLYDRWGELIWESRDPEEGWDGTFKGQPCQVGTYTWVVRAKDLLNDGQYVYNGHVTLLR